MIEGPHIFGFSPVAPCISLASSFASVRLEVSGSASMNAATLSLVGLVLLSAIALAFRFLQKATPEARRGATRPLSDIRVSISCGDDLRSVVDADTSMVAASTRLKDLYNLT